MESVQCSAWANGRTFPPALETAHEASLRLDAQFPWLADAFARSRQSGRSSTDLKEPLLGEPCSSVAGTDDRRAGSVNIRVARTLIDRQCYLKTLAARR